MHHQRIGSSSTRRNFRYGQEESLNWYFARPKIGNYIIDFRHTPKDEAVRKWLATPRGFGSWGGYDAPPDYKVRWTAGGKTFQWATLSKEYDSMIFIERTTRAAIIQIHFPAALAAGVE